MAKKKKTKKKAKRVTAKKTIGILHSGSSSNPDHNETINALIASLNAAGYDSKNLKIIGPLFAEDDPQNLDDLAEALVKTFNVEVLVAAGGTASARAAEKKTTTTKTPVVFTSVSDHARYPDNMTGICALTSALDPDRLALLHDLMPASAMIGVLVNSLRPNFNVEWPNLQAAAAKLNVSLWPQDVPSLHIPAPGQHDNAIVQAFEHFNSANIKAVLVTADPLFNNHRRKIIMAANKHKIPAIYQWSQFAKKGGLMSYGTKLVQAYEMAGSYVGQILDGAKPADKPILDANRELVINLKTAKTIGITVPPMLLARADEIIPARA